MEKEVNTGRESYQLRLVGSRHRWRWVVAGVMLMLGGAAVAVGVVSQGQEQVPIVVVARDVAAGHVLTDADVQVVHASGVESLGLVDARTTEVVGQRVAVPLAEGTPVSQGVLAEADFPAPGEAVVSASVGAGAVPVSVVPGATVAVVIAAGEETSVPTQSIPARVHSISEPETGDAQVVELVVATADAATVARAAARDQLRLVLVAGEG